MSANHNDSSLDFPLSSNAENAKKFNVKEKVDFLFKNYLGFPNTNQSTPYYLETDITSSTYTFGTDVFINPIPDAPSFSAVNASTESEKNAVGLKDTNVVGAVYNEPNGIVRKYEKLVLVEVPNSNKQSWYCPGLDDKNVLADAIQSNQKRAVVGESVSKPYNYSLYAAGTGGGADTVIKPGVYGGNWVFDIKTGVINFTDIGSQADDGSGKILDRLASAPKLTFVKYVGLRGIDSVIQASSDGTNTFQDVSANNIQSNRQAIGALFSEMQDGILLDLCGQRFHDDNKGSAIILPKGENAQRPWVNGYNGGTGDGAAYRKDNAEGALRYNTETKQFEGYSSEAWQGLGGVTDIAQKTKVTASFSSDDSGQDKRLRFFVDGSLNMVFDGSGNIAMGYNYDGAKQTLQDTGFKGTDVSFNDNVNVTIHADMSMNGMFYNTGGMDIDAGVSLTGDLTQVGDFDLTGDITQTGNVSQTGTLTVSGDTKVTPNFIALFLSFF